MQLIWPIKTSIYVSLETVFYLAENFHNAGKMNYSLPVMVHFFQIIIDSNIFKDAWFFHFRRLQIKPSLLQSKKNFWKKYGIFLGCINLFCHCSVSSNMQCFVSLIFPDPSETEEYQKKAVSKQAETQNQKVKFWYIAYISDKPIGEKWTKARLKAEDMERNRGIVFVLPQELLPQLFRHSWASGLQCQQAERCWEVVEQRGKGGHEALRSHLWNVAGGGRQCLWMVYNTWE